MLNQYFEAKKRLYPQSVKGRFRNIKWILNFVFLSIYCLSPFLRFDRGEAAPNQAILIDIANSKLYFFWIEIWAQEVYYLMGILVIAAVTLFFVTSLFGRIWCGYACFQTVWTDIFIALERLFQGDRNDRIILDRKKSFKKFYKKFLTHLSWIIICFFTGFFFVSYFNDAFALTKNILHLQIDFTQAGWILGIGAATYVMAGFAREHVCTFMCPYSRFQSAMFDRNTLIIAYDEKRGEPRGKHKQGETFEGRGHCIDCKQCVVVCPAGIDIRNGLQMECIACGLCVDACDDVMEKVGLPKGLIRYDTMNNMENPSDKNKFKIFQPRTFFYSAILTFVIGCMFTGLSLKPKAEITIIGERNPIFVMLSDGSVRNAYLVKIFNKTYQEKNFKLKILNPVDAALSLETFDSSTIDNLILPPNSSKNFKIYVTLKKDFILQNSEGRGLIEFEFEDESGTIKQKTSAVFISK